MDPWGYEVPTDLKAEVLVDLWAEYTRFRGLGFRGLGFRVVTFGGEMTKTNNWKVARGSLVLQNFCFCW